MKTRTRRPNLGADWLSAHRQACRARQQHQEALASGQDLERIAKARRSAELADSRLAQCFATISGRGTTIMRQWGRT